jgi:hypothetical protein
MYLRELRFDSPILAFCAAIFCYVIPSSAMQRIKGEQCLQAYTSDLKTCTGARESGF